MNPSSSNPSFESGIGQSLEEARLKYLRACQNRLDGSQPPDVEPFLAPFREPEASALRAILEEIQRSFATPDSAHPRGNRALRGTKTEGTTETRQSLSNGKDVAHFSVDGTFDRVPGLDDTVNSDGTADGTANFVPEQLATGEFVESSASTVDRTGAPENTGDDLKAEASTAQWELEQKPAAKAKLPQSVAGYEILSVLGRGAMGVVYKARQRGLKRLVALKMILSGEHASEQDLARFHAEANAVAMLQHSGIVQIYEIGEEGGRPFFSLEFVDGPSLHKKLQGMPLPPKEAASLMQKMAEAMSYAHQRGVIHRDLKPANVLMTSDGIPKIGDFGLAKAIDEDESGLTRTGTIIGTPSYMSPEQAGGLTHEIGPLADVYSLGAILYDMLTGRPPFRGTSVMDTLQQLKTRDPVPPMQLQPGVPRDLETICLKCLEKDRNKRYADAAALAADLKRFLNREPILARPVSRFEKGWRWCQRNPKDAGWISFVLLLLLAGASGGYSLAVMYYGQKEEANVAKVQADEARTVADNKRIEAEAAKLAAIKSADETKIALAEEKKAKESAKDTSKETLQGIYEMFTVYYEVLQHRELSINASKDVRKLRSDAIASLREKIDNLTNRIAAAATATNADLLGAEQLSEMLMKLGFSKEPRDILERALIVAKKRVELNPNSDKSRSNLGIIEQRLGDLELDLEGDAGTANTSYVSARTLHDEVLTKPRNGEMSPLETKISIAHDDVRIGRSLLALGRSAEARKYFEEARGYYREWDAAETPEQRLKVGRPRSYVSQAEMFLGVVAGNVGEIERAREQFDKSIAIVEELLATFKGYYKFRADLAEIHGYYGDAHFNAGNVAEAKAHYEKSLNALKVFASLRPNDISTQPLLALTYERLGIVSSLLKRDGEAKQYLSAAADRRGELFEIDKNNFYRQIDYVLALARSGERINSVRLTNTIATRMLHSPELMLKVARCYAIFSTTCTADRDAIVEQALWALRIALANGFQDVRLILADPELKVLAEEPAFKALVARAGKG